MQIVNIYGRKHTKFCITIFFIFYSFIYLMIQGGGRGGHQNAHIGSHGGDPEGVKFGSHDI